MALYVSWCLPIFIWYQIKPHFYGFGHSPMCAHSLSTHAALGTGSHRADRWDVTLVRLLKARYWAESCETRCTKPFPAVCPSHSCWAFSLNLCSWDSLEANSSSRDCESTGTLAHRSIAHSPVLVRWLIKQHGST